MSLNGFVMMHRKILDWEWYKDIPVRVLFEHLIYIAAFKDSNWKGKEVKRGQAIVGRKSLAEETGLSERQVRTALKKLEKTREITIKATNKYSLITIVNYDFYQSEVPTATNTMTSNRPANDQQMTSNRPHLNNVNTVNTVEKGKNSQSDGISLSGLPDQPPAVAEVQGYCRTMGYERVDVQKFVDHYTGNGWKDEGGNPIRNWKAIVKQWNENERGQKEVSLEQPKQPTASEMPQKTRRWKLYMDASDIYDFGNTPIPPASMKEVLDYFSDYSSFANHIPLFYEYFTQKNWRLNNFSIRDWDAAVRAWINAAGKLSGGTGSKKNKAITAEDIAFKMKELQFEEDIYFWLTKEEQGIFKNYLKNEDWKIKAGR